MNTLRAKLSALLVGAILVVVVLATWSVLFIVRHPSADPLVEQLRIILTVAARSDISSQLPTGAPHLEAGVIGFHANAPAGRILEGPSHHLQDTLRQSGVPYDAAVTELEPDGKQIIALKISQNEWLVLPAEMPSPNTFLPMIGGWLLLVTVGTAGIAVIVVYRMTQPLSLI